MVLFVLCRGREFSLTSDIVRWWFIVLYCCVTRPIILCSLTFHGTLFSFPVYRSELSSSFRKTSPLPQTRLYSYFCLFSVGLLFLSGSDVLLRLTKVIRQTYKTNFRSQHKLINFFRQTPWLSSNDARLPSDVLPAPTYLRLRWLRPLQLSPVQTVFR